jgi:PAS domain S-box-containing protein
MTQQDRSGQGGRSFALIGRIGALAAGSMDVEDGLRTALADICAFTGWPIGHATLVRDGELVGTTIWHGADAPSFEAFKQASIEMRGKPGHGLVGRIVRTGRPDWAVDVTHDPLFLRREAAAGAGIASAVGFPLLSNGEVAGVLELFTFELAEPDEEMLRLMSVVGAELGRLVERSRAEALVRAGEERYRLLFETATDAIFLESRDCRIMAMNKAAEKLTGYTAAELEGQDVYVLIAPEYAEISRVQFERKLRGEERETRFQSVILDRNGRRIPVEVSSALVHRDDVVVGVQAVVRNLDADRRAEFALRESEERFRGAFDAAAIGMGLLSMNGRWLKVNASLCSMVGYTAEELLTMNFQQITHPDDLEADLALSRRLLAGEFPSYQMEKRYVHKDGHTVWIHLSTSLVRDADGVPAYSVAQVLDISDRKHVELGGPVVTPKPTDLPALSPRERQVLALLAEGQTSAETAATLGIGEETVQTHVRRAMTKLAARTRTQAVAIALRHGLLDGPPASAAAA